VSSRPSKVCLAFVRFQIFSFFFLQCGPNAECRHEVFRGEGAETICVCKEGFSGDPDSQRGCNEQTDKSTVRPKEGCIVKNETYAVGEEWYDGCEYKCSCSKKLEILCQVQPSQKFMSWSSLVECDKLANTTPNNILKVVVP
jgi:hypothetical protein